MNSAGALWARQARQWSRLGAPFKPDDDDLAIVQSVLDECGVDVGVILGVTPELVGLRWPAGCTVVATDVSRPMLEGVWRDAATGAAQVAVQGDWAALAVRDGVADVVLGDGVLNQNPAAFAPAVMASIDRLVRGGGVAALRVFVQPAAREPVDAVWDDAFAARIANFHTFKFRLLMALADDRGEIAVAAAHEHFYDLTGGPDDVAARTGWPVEVVKTIDAYNGQSTVYWFPTLADLRALPASGLGPFEAIVPPGQLGERRPTLVWHR